MPRCILAVEHEPASVDAVAELLTEEGYRVRAARDGAEALDLIEREPPDAVVTDVMMPRLDGLALVGRLRERGLAIPVVLISAVRGGVEMPGAVFVPKHVDLERLLAALEAVLGERAA